MIGNVSTKEAILAAIKPLDGAKFKDRESVEDAFLPYFAPLQIYFQGQGHRDLVDSLIRTGVIAKEKEGYVVKLPVAPAPVAAEEIVNPRPQMGTMGPFDPAPEITYSELQTILEIGSAPNGAVLTSKYVMSEPQMKDLMDKGLIQVVNSLPTPQRSNNDHTISTAVQRALSEIDAKDYYAAIGSLEAAAKANDRNNADALVYTLTDLGNSVREKLASVKIKI